MGTPATVTGPFPTEAKADKPVFKVIVQTVNERGTYVQHHRFEAADAGADSKAQALHQAETFARQARQVGV